jgi:hypothetical protein
VEAGRFDRKQGCQCCELFSKISLFNLIVFQEKVILDDIYIVALS